MRTFFSTLRQRNALLYWYGWMNILAAIICLIMISLDDTQVLGINAWIKPMKFYISIAIFSWTMGWLLDYLHMPRKNMYFSWMTVIVLVFEMVVITWQAAYGRLSHFNTTSAFYALLFSLMGIAITILAIWTGYIAYLFFRKKDFTIPKKYVWGIRLGLIIFVIYSFEGGLMASQLAHTVGAPDGSGGLPLVNWSRGYGDLRVAHFFGMHALQVLPLAAWFIFSTSRQVIIFSVVYFLLVTALLVQALFKMPVI